MKNNEKRRNSDMKEYKNNINKILKNKYNKSSKIYKELKKKNKFKCYRNIMKKTLEEDKKFKM
jgi:hypothetical protein